MEYLVGHLVGDYLLQNDWMAREKKRSHFACLIHVLLYCVSVFAFTGWGLLPMASVAIPHFLIDRWGFVAWYMSIGQRDFMQPPLSPWSRIVVDNTFHLVCLFVTSKAFQ